MHAPVEAPFWEAGLDGAWPAVHLEACERCGHVAPAIEHAYPEVVAGAAARRAMLEDPSHAPEASRRLAVAMLFPDDPREEGRWLLRAAWADESANRHDAAATLRLRALDRLEVAVATCRVLDRRAGFTSLILAETARVGGDLARGYDHACRGVQTGAERTTQLLLAFEIVALDHRDRAPRTRMFARDAVDTWPLEQREALLQRARRATVRPLHVTVAKDVTANDLVAFSRDYLTPATLLDLLRAQEDEAVAAAIGPRGLLPALLEHCHATDVYLRDAACRSVIMAIKHFKLELGARELTSVLGWLTSRDVERVRWGAIALSLVAPHRSPDERARIAAAAECALYIRDDRDLDQRLKELIAACGTPRPPWVAELEARCRDVFLRIAEATADQRADVVEGIAWARALAMGGRRDDSVAQLRSLVGPQLPPEGYDVALEIFADAGDFVDECLRAGVLRGPYQREAAASLARLAARAGSPELELRLLREAVTRHVDEHEWRRGERTVAVLHELARSSPPPGRLDAWIELLGDDRHFAAPAVATVTGDSLAQIRARVGEPPAQPEVIWHHLSLELARHRRLADALEAVPRFNPFDTDEAILALCNSPAERRLVLDAYASSPGATSWGLILLRSACGDLDGALDLLEAQSPRERRFNASARWATSAAAWLDSDPSRWTPTRAGRLLSLLADGTADIVPIVPSLVAHLGAGATGALAAGKRESGPVTATQLAVAEAAGFARRRDVDSVTGALREAFAGPCSPSLDGHLLIEAFAVLPLTDVVALWHHALQMFATATLPGPMRLIDAAFPLVDPAHAVFVKRAIHNATLPDGIRQHAYDRLGELVATTIDGPSVLALDVEADPTTLRRRLRQAARHLTRRGFYSSMARSFS